MQLTRFIQELLYQYECVTIPHFGAFLTRSFNAQVDPRGFFYPPRKEVNFNQLLTANDGLLAHYIARKENIRTRKMLECEAVRRDNANSGVTGFWGGVLMGARENLACD